MGGVYYDVPRNMNYDDPYQDLHIHQTKGYRLLSGSDVMQVLRYRHDTDSRYGYADGDLGRIKTQQSLFKGDDRAAFAAQERDEDRRLCPRGEKTTLPPT